MARGGTRKARAAQAEARRKKQQKDKRQADKKAKAARAEGPKAGKGRAFLLHIAGLPAPFVASFGLVLASNVNAAGEPVVSSSYWLAPLIGDPNASYLREPGGFLLFAAVMAVAIAVFFLTPVMVWRAVYKDWEAVRRDRSSVDNSFTMLVVAFLLWLYRIVAGYTPEAFHGIVQLVVLLSVYVPLFSGVLGLILPVVPGSGRIGGIFPDFMKIPFTERMLLTEPEQREVRAAAEMAKDLRRRQYEDARAARAARKKR